MTRDDVINEYFNWLFDLVCGNRYSGSISYKKLLTRLHEINFEYRIPMDQNRAEDGVSLRYRFAIDQGYKALCDLIMADLDRPCSVLEMMVALAIRCEIDIMDDPKYGDRTSQWFWEMIVSLGLGSMDDERFDKRYVDDTIDIFMRRKYKPNGEGGLFTVRHCDSDLRKVEIWRQLCWYLDSIT